MKENDKKEESGAAKKGAKKGTASSKPSAPIAEVVQPKQVETGRVLVEFLVDEAEVGGRKYRRGDQERVNPADAELLVETKVAMMAASDFAKERRVLVDVLTEIKTPGATWYRGHRGELPLSLASRHVDAGEVIIVGTAG